MRADGSELGSRPRAVRSLRLAGGRSVRARSTVAATLVVAAAIVAGSAILVLLLARSLGTSTRENAEARLSEVTQALQDGGLERARSEIAASAVEGQVVQVVDPSGDVVAASARRAQGRALTGTSAAPGQVVQQRPTVLQLLDLDDPYEFIVGGVGTDEGTYRVVVASSLEPRREAVGTTLLLLGIGAPVLLVVVAAASWMVVDRALGPVEQIRSEVDAISSAHLDERVAVPATRDEIAALAETMNAMLARLDRSARTQRQFVSDASHELRSPLSSLSANLATTAGDAPASRWRAVQPVLVAETERMGSLVENLLLLAKADEGLRLDVGDVDLEDLLGEEQLRLGHRDDLSVSVRLAPARVVGDRLRLTQVVRNLVDNASQHARTAVSLDCHREGSRAVVEIGDDGDGIPSHHRDRVFDRFVRLDSSRGREAGGSGLGLAIVAEIVAAHGGSIVILDSPLGGALARVELAAVTFDHDADHVVDA